MQPENLVALTIRDPGKSSEEKAAIALAAAEAISIKTAEDYTEAGGQLKVIKAKHDEIDGARREIVKPIDEARRRIQEFFRGPLSFLERAEFVVKGKMISYTTEQERIAREKQRKADAEAERERQKLAERARRAEAAGKVEKAAELEQQAASVVPAMIPIGETRAPGVVNREIWRAECTDLRALVQAIAKGEAPISLVTPNDKVIGQQARSLKKEFVAPGIRVWSEKNLAA